jgi:isoquinoline 1-oxidoreductase beta subunit
MTTTISKLSRRQFLATAAAAGGGLALGIDAGGIRTALGQIAIGGTSPGNELGVWVFIKPNDDVVIRVARSEMGQGSLTGLAQLVAEELDCDWSKVTAEYPTPGQNLARNRAWGDMSTGGSRGIRGSQDYVRQGGAAARQMLLQAAANEWKVPVEELKVDKGVITHEASMRQTTYGKVADAAGKLPVPDLKSMKLRDPRTGRSPASR